MDFWLASANVGIIEKYYKLGLFKGVITNPHVVAEEKKDPKKLFRKICERVDYAYYQLEDVSAEEMLKEAHEFLEINPDKMRIKVPATMDGLEVISALSREGSHIMATCVPTRAWMIFAISAGAKVIAPYSGMLQRAGICLKAEEVIEMQIIIDSQGYDVQLCTGIYDVTEIPMYASHGIKSCFIWGKDVEKYLSQPLVQDAVGAFRSDWEAIRGKY
jgi:transaldolase